MDKMDRLLERVSELIRVLTERGREESLPAMLTPFGMARELSCSVSKVRGMMRSGALATVRVGGRLMIPRRELERLLERSDEVTLEQEPATALSIPHRRRGSVASEVARGKALIAEDNRKSRKR